MLIGRRIRLYPTKEQEARFYEFCNTARFVYNESLAFKIQCYENEGYSCTVKDLLEHIYVLRYSGGCSWLYNTPLAVIQQSIRDLDNAYNLFFKRGNKGFPKFKKRGKSKLSFYSGASGFRQVDSTHIKVTGIKTYIRIKETKISSHIFNPRISFDGKFWYLSYSFNYEESKLIQDGDIIGVDLGIKSLAVTSDEVVYNNINKSDRVRKLEKRKKHLQRQLSRKYEMNKQGRKFIKTKNILKLEKEVRLIDRRLKNIRDTYIHTVTMNIVRTKPYAVVIEDLNVSGMLKNKHLSKDIQQQEFYKFRQYMTYKCQAYGSRLIVADRFYPSSKKCSNCGAIKKRLSLSDRSYACASCGIYIDRDLNAAINLKNYGKEKVNLAS